jgi:PPOX class probable F420-dependent enzyme
MIQPNIAELLKGPNFGTVTTLLRNGDPMSHVMWVDCDEEYVLVNTELHRKKYENVLRDPRVCITVWERNDPNEYVEIRGRVVEIARGDEARAHIDRLSLKYDGVSYPSGRIKSERVILKVAPRRQRAFLRKPHVE